jgi:hypothetical protein
MAVMGVDGIGGGRPIPGAGAGELDAAQTVDGAAGAAGALGSARAGGSALLERLRSGEIDVEQYLDAQVTAATTHVQAALSPGQLDFIRGALREQLATDPVLIELVRRATGAAPPTRTD